MKIENAQKNTESARGGDAMRKWLDAQNDFRIAPAPQNTPGASGTRNPPTQ